MNECNLDECTFSRHREAGFSHICQSHTTIWLCNSRLHATCTFNTDKGLDAHTRATHERASTEVQLLQSRKRSKTHTTTLFTQRPLCAWAASDEDLSKIAGRRRCVHGPQAEYDRILSDLVVSVLRNTWKLDL